MQRLILRDLVQILKLTYGSAYQPWGTAEYEAEGTGFVIVGLPLYFSVLAFGDIPENLLDVQITSNMPISDSFEYDQYLHEGSYTIGDFLRLVESYP
jgi:hypothetical protein